MTQNLFLKDPRSLFRHILLRTQKHIPFCGVLHNREKETQRLNTKWISKRRLCSEPQQSRSHFLSFFSTLPLFDLAFLLSYFTAAGAHHYYKVKQKTMKVSRRSLIASLVWLYCSVLICGISKVCITWCMRMSSPRWTFSHAVGMGSGYSKVSLPHPP